MKKASKTKIIDTLKRSALVFNRWRAVYQITEIDLVSANLESANLESANLKFANLWWANLVSANLESANIEYANLESANLKSANLKFANLGWANLKSANLESANLEYANLEYANLGWANLKSANMKTKQPKPEDFGYYGGGIAFLGWRNLADKKEYDAALSAWEAEQKELEAGHSVTEATYIAYSKVVAARGWKAGDKVRTRYGVELTIVSAVEGEHAYFEVTSNRGHEHQYFLDNLLFEVKAVYTFK